MDKLGNKTLIGASASFTGKVINARVIEVNGRMNADLTCLLYTSPSPRDRTRSRMPSSA